MIFHSVLEEPKMHLYPPIPYHKHIPTLKTSKTPLNIKKNPKEPISSIYMRQISKYAQSGHINAIQTTLKEMQSKRISFPPSLYDYMILACYKSSREPSNIFSDVEGIAQSCPKPIHPSSFNILLELALACKLKNRFHVLLKRFLKAHPPSECKAYDKTSCLLLKASESEEELQKAFDTVHEWKKLNHPQVQVALFKRALDLDSLTFDGFEACLDYKAALNRMGATITYEAYDFLLKVVLRKESRFTFSLLSTLLEEMKQLEYPRPEDLQTRIKKLTCVNENQRKVLKSAK